MRPRTPTFLWIPFVFSIGTISWAFLLAGLVLLAGVIIFPAMTDVRKAEAERNNYQASEDLLDQRIAHNDEFIKAATDKDPPLMKRLADRQLNILPKDPNTYILYPAARNKDRSVNSLIAESLTPVTPKVPAPLPPFIENTLGNPTLRPIFIITACLALAISFFLGVKYERALSTFGLRVLKDETKVPTAKKNLRSATADSPEGPRSKTPEPMGGTRTAPLVTGGGIFYSFHFVKIGGGVF